MSYECKACGFTTKTEGGLKLHMMVKHADSPKESTKVAKPKKVEKPKKKPTENVVAESKSRHKKQLEEYKLLEKSWPKSGTKLSVGSKVTKKEIKAIFPKGTNTYVDGKMNKSVALYPLLESSYLVTSREMKNGWKRISLIGNTHNVSWKEGPLNNKYRVTIPSVRSK